MGRHERTLHAILEEPTRSGVTWRAVEALLLTFGAELSEGHGSRVRVALNGVRAVLHRPHPTKELSRAMVRSLGEFLANAGVH